jgi:hypothetical protein
MQRGWHSRPSDTYVPFTVAPACKMRVEEAAQETEGSGVLRLTQPRLPRLLPTSPP